MLWIVLGLVLMSFGLLVAALVTSRTGWAWGSVGASGIAAGLLAADWMGRRRIEPDDHFPFAPYQEYEVVAAPNADVDPAADDRPAADAGTTADSAAVDRAAVHPAPVGPAGVDPPAVDQTDADVEPAAGVEPDDPVVDGADPTVERAAGEQPEDPAPVATTEAAPEAAAGPEPEPVRPQVVVAPVRRTSLRPPPIRIDPSVEPPEESTDAADAIVVSDLTDEVVVIDERPRYHLSGCRWVGTRQTLPLPVDEARELGFGPCAVCRPDFTLAARHRAARS